MTVYTTQMNFSRGEFSPRMANRFDTELYKAAAKLLKNWVVMKQGGLIRRSGTEFIGKGKLPVTSIRLIPFVFSTVQAYVLEFGNFYIRVYNVNGQVVNAGVPVEIASPYSSAEIFDIDFAQSADVLYLAHGNFQPRKITRTSDTAWTISLHVFLDGPYLDEPKVDHGVLTFSATGNLIPKMTSNVLPSGTASATGVSSGAAWQTMDRNIDSEAEFTNTASFTIGYAFAAGSKIAVGYSIRCRDVTNLCGISRWHLDGFDGTSWVTLDTGVKPEGWQMREKVFIPVLNTNAFSQYRLFVFGSDSVGPSPNNFVSILEWQISEDPNTQTPMTCTASSVNGINGGVGFTANDVGRAIRIRGQDNLFRWFRITSFTSTTVVSGVIYGCPLEVDGEAISRWQLGAFYGPTNWPHKVAFFEERLVWGRTDAEPQKLWASGVDDFANHEIHSPLVGDDALDADILGGQVNAIQFMIESQDLLIGTLGAARVLGVSDSQKGFSATNVKQRPHTFTGASGVKPVMVSNVAVFLDRLNNIIREFVYSFEQNGYITPELSIISEHLVQAGVVQMAYAQQPDSIIWVVTVEGKLVALTYDRNNRITAMAPEEIGGDAIVESVACIPGPDRDEVWLVVNRHINGSVARYIERLSRNFDPNDDALTEATMLDSWIGRFGSPAHSFSGLTHLANETITAFADGFHYHGLVISAAGVATLPVGINASRVIFGYPYVSRLEQLPPPDPGPDGSLWGRAEREEYISIDAWGSLGLRVGSASSGEGADLYDLYIRDPDLEPELDIQMDLRTGPREAEGGVDFSWLKQDSLAIEVSDPYPAIIRSVTIGIEGEP